MRRQKSGSFGFAKGWLAGWAKPNVPLAGWLKLFLKNVRWEKNKKHRVGNECRLTRCPFAISFLCLWSPVKMVYFFLFLSVVCLSCRCLNTLAANVSGLCEVAENRSVKFRFRRHVAKANSYLLNYEKKPIKLAFADYEAQTFNLSLNPPFCKTLVGGCAYISLSSLRINSIISSFILLITNPEISTSR